MKLRNVLFMSLMVTACGQANQNVPSQLDGYYTHSTHWKKNSLIVCWKSGGFKTEKAWVREAIERTWEAVIPIDFKKWDSCKWERDEQITIEIADETPYTQGLGKELDEEFSSNHMLLNFKFERFSSDCLYGTPEYRRQCIESDAIHEFGHAIGINHEHQRPDSKCHLADAGGEPGDTTVGDYDEHSVMNYCNTIKHQNVLSEGDIATAQAMYGPRQ